MLDVSYLTREELTMTDEQFIAKRDAYIQGLRRAWEHNQTLEAREAYYRASDEAGLALGELRRLRLSVSLQSNR